MTQNQINYAKHIEQQRHNLATESQDVASLAETTRSNKAREKETHRSNRSNERETKRSNKTRERETKRHNKATELTANKTLTEQNRHNLADEGIRRDTNTETNRHNLATENLTNKQIDTGLLQSRIAADATTTAASISAAAAKYAADLNKAAQDLRTKMDYVTNTNKTRSQEQIAADNRASNEAINALNRMQQAINNNDKNAIENARLDIERRKQEVEAAYKRGELSNDIANTLIRALEAAWKTSTDAYNALSRSRR